MNDWPKFTVEELIAKGIIERPMDGNHGSIHPKSSDYVEAGIPFVMASDLLNGRVDISGCAFITEKNANALRKGFAREGDVLLSHKATIGRVAIVQPSDHPFMMLTPQVTFYRVSDAESLSNRFLYYYFQSRNFLDVLEQWAGAGSTRSYLGITGQRKLPIALPPIKIQHEIAETLGALDDKIELNRKTATTLEEMARALYRSWFVDFDPVRARAEGRSPSHMDAATAALFPEDFGRDGLPAGWEASTIGTVAEVVGGSTPSTGEERFWTGGQHAWATPKDLSDLGQAFLFETERKVTQEGLGKITSKLSPAGTLLLSSRAPIGYLALATMPVAINQGFIAIRETESISGIEAYFWCAENMGLIHASANGSTFQEISKKNFRPLAYTLAPAAVRQAFIADAGRWFARIKELTAESRTLATLRDTLLPRLMSGELRVGAAREMIEDAA